MDIVAILSCFVVPFVFVVAGIVSKMFTNHGHKCVRDVINSMLKVVAVLLVIGFAIIFSVKNFDEIADTLYMVFSKNQIDNFRAFFNIVFGTRSVFFSLQVMLSIVYLILALIFISLFSYVMVVTTISLFYKVSTVEKVVYCKPITVRNERVQSKIFLMTRKLRL